MYAIIECLLCKVFKTMNVDYVKYSQWKQYR